MYHFHAHFHAVAACLALGACAGEVPKLALSDAQNYRYEIEADGTLQTIASGLDTRVVWDGLDEDLLGDPVAPAAMIDAVNIVHFGIPQAEVLRGIACGSLRQADVVAFVSVEPRGEQLSAMLSEFSLQGTQVDPAVDIVEDVDGSYLVSASSTDETGVVTYYGYAFFGPTTGAPEADLALDPSTSSLEVAVDLASIDTIEFPAGRRAPIVDWRGLTTGSCGPIDLSDIDTLQVQRFDMGVEELQVDFVHADELASTTWVQHEGIAGYGDFDLADLSDSSEGEPFEGIDDAHTWLLALSCSTCLSPAPPFVGVMKPDTDGGEE
jgi:hypothetical protein